MRPVNRPNFSLSNPPPPAAFRRRVSDGYLLLVVTLLAFVIRLPYRLTLPPTGDEVGQLIYSLRIVNGQAFPLVGNDAYAGPFYVYLLALLLRLGIKDPMLGSTVILITSTLIAPLTYAWVRRLHGNQTASVVAAALVAANPHLILFSHLGATTFLLPFFTTLFLWCLSSAVDSDHPGWLIAAAVAAGLALQANPVAGLPVTGGWVWMAIRVRRSPRLSRGWPLWPLMGGLCVALVYSPVLFYNVTSRLNSMQTLEQRSYLWEVNHTPQTFLSNAWRLALQVVRQASGVLTGEETIHTILGLPLLYLTWMAAGLVFMVRRISLLPLALLLPVVVVLPYFSNHYGLIMPPRFTTFLTPVFAAGMGLSFAWGLERLEKPGWGAGRGRQLAAYALAAALTAYPLVALFQYYDFMEKNDLSSRTLLELSRQMVAANRGERVYISYSASFLDTSGVPYVPQAHLILANIRQDFLPPEQIIGRLFEFPGPATLLLGEADAAIIQQVASLTPWPGEANARARARGFGLYTLNTDVPLIKPDYVLTGARERAAAPKTPLEIPVGGGLELIGYDAPERLAPGDTLDLAIYWRRTGPMPAGRYIGFVHLLDAAPLTLVAQNDHVLGQDRYPVNAWQPGEIVVDHYVLRVALDVAPGQYGLRTGVYTWPDQRRLDVPGHTDNLIELQPLHIGP